MSQTITPKMKSYSSSITQIMKTPMMMLLLLSAAFLSSINSAAHGWVTPTPSHQTRLGGTGDKHPSVTAAFYRAEMMTAPVVSESTSTTPQQQTKERRRSRGEEVLSFGKLPWLNQEGCGQEEDNNVYRSHWNWQLSYFEQKLSNLRVKTTEHGGDGENDNDSDLMYVADEQKQQRVYTVSMRSDEYHEIRMTYMSFPGAQFFRCACYPRSPEIPIMGMGLMQFGGAKNMAVMDYQPLPSCGDDDDENPGNAQQALYESELRRIRAGIPSMSQPISRKHFDSSEERKYFTDVPLKSSWTAATNNGDDNTAEKEHSHEFYRRELERAHRDFVRSHVELTQRLLLGGRAGEGSSSSSNSKGIDAAAVLKLHSDFDTFISAKEPAGNFLSGAFGKDIGNKLVHNVLFPLSRNGVN